MHPEERDQLNSFLTRLEQQPAPGKDPEAEALIRKTCTRQPDAPYLLVQRVLLLEQALQEARGQAARLHDELEQSRSGAGSGFLNGNTWGNGSARPVPAAAPWPPAPSATPAGGSGWLGNVATTAAGVVAGSFLFQGIEHLLGGHAQGNGWLSGGGAQLTSRPDETTIVNNYYGADNSGSNGNFDALMPDGFTGSDNDPDWI